MRRAALLLGLLFAVPAAQAHPLGVVGRAFKNMFTCEHRAACIEQWAIVGAVSLDAITTMQRIDRCPRCREFSPLLGNHPSKPLVGITVPLWGIGMVTLTQGLHEHARTGGDRGFANLVPAVAAVAHTAAAAGNLSCRPASTALVCR